MRLLLLLASVALPCDATAQSSDAEVGVVCAYNYTSKAIHNRSLEEATLADEHVVRVKDASFLQLEFSKLRLSAGSLLELTSLADGAVEVFDARSEHLYSYYFNGDAVRVRLFAGPGTKADHFAISSLSVGNRGSASLGPNSKCGTIDSRAPSADKRVARVVFKRPNHKVYVATAFLMGRVNCFSSNLRMWVGGGFNHIIEFDVPPSNSKGEIQHPSPTKQYRISANGNKRWIPLVPGVGNDWSLFQTDRNSVTRDHAEDAQGHFFRLSKTSAPASVTSYGAHSTSTRRFVQQTSSGSTYEKVGTLLKFQIDTGTGSQGAPVFSAGGFAVAIVNDDGCTTDPKSRNKATLVANTDYDKARAKMCAWADLRIDAFVPSATTLQTSLVYSAKVTVGNHGNVPSSACTTAIVLSDDSVITGSDPVLATLATPIITIDQSFTTTKQFRMPASTPSATCYLAAWADSTFVVGELDNGNNQKLVRVTCVRDLRPNLRISKLTASTAKITPSQAFTMSTVTLNDSVVAVRLATRTGLYLSDNATISTSDLLLGEVAVPTLRALESYRKTSNVVAPLVLKNANCWLGAYADKRKQLAEFDEINGLGIPIKCVDPRPDLVVSSISVSPGRVWQAGGTIAITTRTSNVGGAPIRTSTSTSIHLSNNDRISIGDPCLAYFSVPSLGAGQSYVRTSNVVFNHCYRTSTAQWYIGAHADSRWQVQEINEANNGLAHPGTRTIASYKGSGRYLSYEYPLIGSSFGKFGGPVTPSVAMFKSVNGGVSKLCVTAPQDKGKLVILLMSGSARGFQYDLWSSLSLGIPLHTPALFANPTGQAFTWLRLPPFRAGGTLTTYTYSLWFNAAPFSFAGLGSNSLKNLIHP